MYEVIRPSKRQNALVAMILISLTAAAVGRLSREWNRAIVAAAFVGVFSRLLNSSDLFATTS